MIYSMILGITTLDGEHGDQMPDERVTVTLPREMVDDIDRRERNRSKFIRGAIRRELERRLRDDMRQSLENPHVDSGETSELGLGDWFSGAAEAGEELLDESAGQDVEWVAGKGWTEVRR